MKIQILGMGCLKCQKLEENAEKAAKELGIDFQIEKIKEPEKIIDFGVMITPALAVNGKVLSAGKVLSVDEIKKLLSCFCRSYRTTG